MPAEYFKRHRMRIDLAPPVAVPALPAGYGWRPWHDALADAHAAVLWQAFRAERDAVLFPNLAAASGCRMLVRCIRDCLGFCPAATWLLEGPAGPAGCIQGLLDFGDGGVQNLAVLPDHRGRGLGGVLLAQALAGFRACGAERVELEVTAANRSAVGLYRRAGFRVYKTDYRSVEVPDRSTVGLGI